MRSSLRTNAVLAKNARVPPAEPSDQLSAGLYIVATPIGNLGDITMRAVDVLTRCDLIACEDTRVTGKLLKHLDIRKPMRRYNDHSDDNERASLVAEAGVRAVVLASDAGTPLISDPGYRMVRDAKAAGVAITTLPGPCAAIAGLTLSGLPTDRFHFAGFLPVKDMARRQSLEALGMIDATLVFYETGPRLLKSLAAIGDLYPGRSVAVARELTKLHEECRTASAETLIAHYSQQPPKGEIVLIVGPPPQDTMTDAEVERLLREMLQTNKASQAAGLVAKATGRDRKVLYARAMELRG
ncbi:MAG: 16S rRNA (cytidine(1402)-2'-O)-methyltransferase [Pontixanthobacter sp.]